MFVDLSVPDYRVLRALAKAGTPLPGRALRIDMNRRTKDGTFLADLVRDRVIKIVGHEPDSSPDDPWTTLYDLTDAGRRADQDLECPGEIVRDAAGNIVAIVAAGEPDPTGPAPAAVKPKVKKEKAAKPAPAAAKATKPGKAKTKAKGRKETAAE